MPYFFDRLWVDSPATDRAPPPSESLFLLLPVERWELLRVILGVAEDTRSRRLNLPPDSDATEGGRLGCVAVAASGVGGTELFFGAETGLTDNEARGACGACWERMPFMSGLFPDMLGARLGA